MGQAQPKMLNPTKPSECHAAMSMSEDDAEHPYMSIFYTAHEGRITFFGLRVAGTQTTDVEGQKLLVYHGERVGLEAGTIDPDKGDVLIAGTLDNGRMEIDGSGEQRSCIALVDQDNATDFVSAIRMVYSMAAHGE